MNIKPSEIRYQKIQKHVNVIADKPREGAKCRLLLGNTRAEGITLDKSVTAILSDGFEGILTVGENDTPLDRTIEEIIQTMRIEEVGLITIYLQTDAGQAVVKFEVWIRDVENEPHFFEWDNARRFQTAMHHKTRGVELHRAGRSLDAFFRFSRALKMVISIAPEEEVGGSVRERAQVANLRTTLFNNLAMCQLNHDNFAHAVDLCNRVLAYDSKNVKALYRRAVAYIGKEEFDPAKSDLSKVLSLDPGNTCAMNKQSELEAREKQQDSQFAEVAKKMLM